MTCPLCEAPVSGSSCPCGWAAEQAGPVKSTFVRLQGGITREEFGQALYDVVFTIGGILQLRDMREQTTAVRVKSGQYAEWQRRERALLAELPRQMAALSDADAGEVARRYPWVAKC